MKYQIRCNVKSYFVITIQQCCLWVQYLQIPNREIVFCLFVRQEITEEPKKTQYPIVDFMDIGQPPQSKSQKGHLYDTFTS